MSWRERWPKVSGRGRSKVGPTNCLVGPAPRPASVSPFVELRCPTGCSSDLPIILLSKDLKQRKGLWGTENSQASETPNAGFDLNGDETIQPLENLPDKKILDY